MNLKILHAPARLASPAISLQNFTAELAISFRIKPQAGSLCSDLLQNVTCTSSRSCFRLLAYNLGNLWRRLVLPKRIDAWSLTSLQQRLVKTGGRLVKHARSFWLFLAESHLTRRLFGVMLRRIWALPVPAD